MDVKNFPRQRDRSGPRSAGGDTVAAEQRAVGMAGPLRVPLPPRRGLGPQRRISRQSDPITSFDTHRSAFTTAPQHRHAAHHRIRAAFGRRPLRGRVCRPGWSCRQPRCAPVRPQLCRMPRRHVLRIRPPRCHTRPAPRLHRPRPRRARSVPPLRRRRGQLPRAPRPDGQVLRRWQLRLHLLPRHGRQPPVRRGRGRVPAGPVGAQRDHRPRPQHARELHRHRPQQLDRFRAQLQLAAAVRRRHVCDAQRRGPHHGAVRVNRFGWGNWEDDGETR